MKRWCAALVVLLALLALLGGCENPDASGRWVSDDTDFSFELDKDGSCMMFDADDVWVSSGTYTVDGQTVSFDMDTGAFTWIWKKDTMTFEANGTTIVYRRSE